jgi:hypothetical protein
MDAYQYGTPSMKEHDVHAGFCLQTTSTIPFQMWTLSMVFRTVDQPQTQSSPYILPILPLYEAP